MLSRCARAWYSANEGGELHAPPTATSVVCWDAVFTSAAQFAQRNRDDKALKMDTDGSNQARFELGPQRSHAVDRQHMMHENPAGLAKSYAYLYGPKVRPGPDPVRHPRWKR